MGRIEPEKKKSLKVVIRWIFGVLFLLMCFSAIVEFHIIAGLLFLLATIVSIPPAATKLEKKYSFRMSGKVRFFLIFVIIMFASAALPPANSTAALNNSTDTIEAPLISGNDTTTISVPSSTVALEVATTSDNKGTLDIVTSPTGAFVTVDGISQGLSPVTGLSIDQGKHTVDLYLSGYNPKKLTVDITSLGTKTISWTFIPYVSHSPTSTETNEVTPTEISTSDSSKTQVTTSDSKTQVTTSDSKTQVTASDSKTTKTSDTADTSSASNYENSKSTSTTTSSTINTNSGSIIANSNTNVYHNAGCRYVEKIKPENLITFSSREEAEKAGYRACKVCSG